MSVPFTASLPLTTPSNVPWLSIIAMVWFISLSGIGRYCDVDVRVAYAFDSHLLEAECGDALLQRRYQRAHRCDVYRVLEGYRYLRSADELYAEVYAVIEVEEREATTIIISDQYAPVLYVALYAMFPAHAYRLRSFLCLYHSTIGVSAQPCGNDVDYKPYQNHARYLEIGRYERDVRDYEQYGE